MLLLVSESHFSDESRLSKYATIDHLTTHDLTPIIFKYDGCDASDDI